MSETKGTTPTHYVGPNVEDSLSEYIAKLEADTAALRAHSVQELARHLGLGEMSPERAYAFLFQREQILRKVQSMVQTQKSDAPDAESALLERLNVLDQAESQVAALRAQLEKAESMIEELTSLIEEKDSEETMSLAKEQEKRYAAEAALTDLRAQLDETRTELAGAGLAFIDQAQELKHHIQENEALRARLAVPAWQPMETAPKDGTDILATDGNACAVVRWLGDGFYGDANDDAISGLTRWMSLPPPPSEQP
jgi:multidrug efflux pump subunit AcrA (membrane-fusion protein)